MRKVYIYALINPINNYVFYIGASINPKTRLSQHIGDPQCNNVHKFQTITSILSEGLTPEMEILHECVPSSVKFWEEFYIDLYKSYGFELKQMNFSTYKSYFIEPNIKFPLSLDKNIYEALMIISGATYVKPSKIICYLLRERIKQFADNPHYSKISEQLLDKLYPNNEYPSILKPITNA